MKIKVSRATNIQIDWLVAKCKGTVKNMLCGHGDISYTPHLSAPSIREYWRPSENWAQGGPILTSEHISRTIDHSGLWIAYWSDGYTEGDEGKKWMQCDRSELVAGLRCYVASELGEEVEVPDDL